MEMELEPRVKPLPFKIKAMSRESPSQKASHVLDPDLRNHWSTATNTKEWILLELDEPCLLSHIRIYNKSVLEWEIAVGLRYKPETFVKVRPRCEAPRRDMMYPMNYTPCRYVRISCLRGNPIAIFFIQAIGVSVSGLEPEFLPVVSHLLPQIVSHKQDVEDMHLQLLQDMTNRLVPFIPQLEGDLNNFLEAPEPSLRFLAMLAGPLYPILYVVNERETARLAGNNLEFEASKNSQPSSALTVSSNYEPRRSRSTSPSFLPTATSLVFRPDAIFMLLRKAYREAHLGIVCRMASSILLKLLGPLQLHQPAFGLSDPTSPPDEASKADLDNPPLVVDYSNLFGEEFQILDDHWDANYLSVLDVGAIEEGMLHVLYACSSQPILCSKLADSSSDFWVALPLVQALLPALRPIVSSLGHVDDSFSQWKQPSVQRALSQIVATSSSPVYRPLLHACAGYLSSFSPSHAKSACVLIDLCSGVLAPWMAQVIVKVDMTLELLEGLLGVIQGARHSLPRARAALKYIVMAISGHMDDMMAKYKDVMHQILFLVEMLEPFLDPAITPTKSMIAFGNVSSVFQERQEHNCAIVLNIIRTAVKKPAILRSLESEWRRGSVAPSVLLSILEPQMQLPPDIDLCNYPVCEQPAEEMINVSSLPSVSRFAGASSRFHDQDDIDGKADASLTGVKVDTFEDASLFFAPTELRSMALTSISGSLDLNSSDSKHSNISNNEKHHVDEKISYIGYKGLVLDSGFSAEYLDLQADFLQLMNYLDCESRASEFRRLASDLHSQPEISPEGHDAAVDALLLAAECYVNPFFMRSSQDTLETVKRMSIRRTRVAGKNEFEDPKDVLKKNNVDLETLTHLESRRDKLVLQILLEAAEMDRNYQEAGTDMHLSLSNAEENEEAISLSQRDMPSTDALTLVRQNQALLCNFLIKRLRKEQTSLNEVLLQSLLFLLQSATKLFCSPENVIDIILGSAEYLNGLLTSFCHQFKEGNLQLDAGKVYEVKRRWMLLQKLIVVSSGGDEGPSFSINVNNGFRFSNLIPAAAWMQKIPAFSSCASPLVRFLGWMAVSRNAKEYLKERLFLASDLSQLTCLLSIFSDELALVDNIFQERDENSKKVEQLIVKEDKHIDKGPELRGQHVDISFQAMYPDISHFLPSMRKQFETFGETILEAVGLQLRSLSSGIVPDLLCWFSDLCLWPFFREEKNLDYFRGFIAKNAKAILLYVLEAIVVEHMEAIVPEIPRVLQVLVSLSKASYCDVSFLDSILHLLNPIISYSLQKVCDEEKLLTDDSCLNFESLCFEELFANIKGPNENDGVPVEKNYSRATTIFILASLFSELSFPRRKEILMSLISWADFATSEQTTYFHDYLRAFQTLMSNCKILLVETLRVRGVIPVNLPLCPDANAVIPSDSGSGSNFIFLNDVYQSSCPTEVPEKLESINSEGVSSCQKVYHLSVEETEDFSKYLEGLISRLNPTIDLCWNIHRQLAKELTIITTECFTYLRCLSSVANKALLTHQVEDEQNLSSKSIDQSADHWEVALEGLAEMIMVLQETHCWQVASVMLDCLLGVPQCFHLDSVISTVCTVIKNFACCAPKIAWRMQTDKWLSFLFARGVDCLYDCEVSFTNLLHAMIGHSEPEQRFIALKHLGKLVGRDVFSGLAFFFSASHNNISDTSDFEPILRPLVSSTWDQVSLLASSDASMILRTCAMALLIDYTPYAERRQLQSILASADNVLHVLGRCAYSTCEGPFVQLSLVLLANVCLHSPAEDVFLIPQYVWRNIETLGLSNNEGKLGDLERKACQALCRLKCEGDDAKQDLKEVLSSSTSKQVSSDFGRTRESVLQVLANLTSVQSYFDFFSRNIEHKDLEIEEAEMELDLLQKGQMVLESTNDLKESCQLYHVATYANNDDRLQQIKESIRLIEKSRLEEEIMGRRRKKLLTRRARQKYLEESALREAELRQELDRERTTEAEREIERQKLLELERAKTRELRHQLDMEKEKQAQRELQRELEQVESGFRPSRREFSSSTHSSRPRGGYRERENGRSGTEGSLRANVIAGALQADTGASNLSMPPVVSGSRPFSGQVPTILQPRDRLDECGSSYEENFEGSKDSGDTGSVGDPELVSAFEGQPMGGLGSSQRQGSRGSKSRQAMDRREREGRREGKWERKHY